MENGKVQTSASESRVIDNNIDATFLNELLYIEISVKSIRERKKE
jgi:hypothetical protein